ncbi:adenylate kinase [Striga asiatica]|uniref:Adenylate kinase n=1 Tax=Striga asiatica TaxID=4170 RepID=A0A5A7P9M9_STRAF|nr:adenylate kinase [Striga asiatica]
MGEKGRARWTGAPAIVPHEAAVEHYLQPPVFQTGGTKRLPAVDRKALTGYLVVGFPTARLEAVEVGVEDSSIVEIGFVPDNDFSVVKLMADELDVILFLDYEFLYRALVVVYACAVGDWRFFVVPGCFRVGPALGAGVHGYFLTDDIHVFAIVTGDFLQQAVSDAKCEYMMLIVNLDSVAFQIRAGIMDGTSKLLGRREKSEIRGFGFLTSGKPIGNVKSLQTHSRNR